MYVIVHDKYKDPRMKDEHFRKSFLETMEKVEKMDPKVLAPQRRLLIKATHFQGKTPELIGKCAAIRAAMTREINR